MFCSLNSPFLKYSDYFSADVSETQATSPDSSPVVPSAAYSAYSVCMVSFNLMLPPDSLFLCISPNTEHTGSRILNSQSLNMKHTLSERMCYVFVLSCVQLFKTLCSVAHQVPLSLGFSRQYCSGLPFPSPGDLLDPGIEPTSLASPGLVGRFFTTVLPGKPK